MAANGHKGHQHSQHEKKYKTQFVRTAQNKMRRMTKAGQTPPPELILKAKGLG